MKFQIELVPPRFDNAVNAWRWELRAWDAELDKYIPCDAGNAHTEQGARSLAETSARQMGNTITYIYDPEVVS
jgi:hypothetical protein